LQIELDNNIEKGMNHNERKSSLKICRFFVGEKELNMKQN